MEAWRLALHELAAGDAVCREMGRRARALAEGRYNIGAFTTHLAHEVSLAWADRRPIRRI